MSTTTGLRRALQHRDLRLMFGGLAVSASGSWAYNVALIVYAYQETHSAAWVAAATVGRFVPTLLTQSYAGVVAERFERVRVMVTADLLCTAFMTVVAVLASMHAPVLLVLVFAALTSVTAGVYPPAVTAMIPQVAGEEDLAAANALNGTVDNLAVIAGPAIGAAMLALGPPPVAFAINAATFLFSALIVMRMSARSVPTDVTAEGNVLKQVISGFTAITTSTTAAVLVGFSVLASFIYGTDTVALVYVSEDKLGTGADGYGYLLAAMGVGGVLAAVLVDRLASSPRLGLIIVIGMAVYCLPTALLIGTHSPALAAVIEAVRGAGTLVVDVLAVTLLQRSLPQDMIARVFGAFFTLVLGAICLGSLVGAQLMAHVSLDVSLVLLAVVVPAACVACWPYVNRMDRQALQTLAGLRPRITLLEALDIFSAAKRPTLERLAAALEEVEVPTGRDVVTQGDTADALWVVVSGEVAVTAKGKNRKPQLLRTMGPRSYFGEIGLLERIPRTATVTALEPTRLFRLPGEEFLDALTSTTATSSLLEGARTRLARTNPSYQPEHLTLPGTADDPAPTDQAAAHVPEALGWPSD
jgi:MFS family permease